MDAWDIFCMTGHIDDYLHYRQGMNAMPQNAPAAKEKQTICPRTALNSS